MIVRFDQRRELLRCPAPDATLTILHRALQQWLTEQVDTLLGSAEVGAWERGRLAGVRELVRELDQLIAFIRRPEAASELAEAASDSAAAAARSTETDYGKVGVQLDFGFPTSY